ncbi:MAG: pyridoxal phosphate enzyme (YggS family) [Bradymonadia bacterium]|jgi:pyridoxal phosphate enzyme (YggS family)
MYRSKIDAQLARIRTACESIGRDPSEVTLIAVSKTHGAEAIEGVRQCGISDFGESYVNDWKSKRDDVGTLRWHFIGHLQSNKAKDVCGRVACLHSVDRMSLVKALAKEGASQDVMIQVNVSVDAAKSGCKPNELPALLTAVAETTNLRAVGLMTIGALVEDAEDARPYFRALRQLRDELNPAHPDLTLLSMGMSQDLEVAVEEGATHVRVGTAIFGPRGIR